MGASLRLSLSARRNITAYKPIHLCNENLENRKSCLKKYWFMSKTVLYPVMSDNSSPSGKPHLANHVRENLIACRKPKLAPLLEYAEVVCKQVLLRSGKPQRSIAAPQMVARFPLILSWRSAWLQEIAKQPFSLKILVRACTSNIIV